MSRKQVARWILTYPLDEADIADLRETSPVGGPLFPDGIKPPELKYCSYQLERGEKTGLFHYQMYCVFGRSYDFNWVKKTLLSWFGTDRIHMEPARGSHEQCETYCTKLETRVMGPFRLGDPESVGSGARTDLNRVQELLDSGGNMDQVRKEHFREWCKYREAFSDYVRATRLERKVKKFEMENFNLIRRTFEETKAWLIWGKTGTGKTNYALAHFNNPLLVRHMDDLKQLKIDHDGIVFDDLEFGHCPFSMVKGLLDADFDSPIHCRYFNAMIPAGMPRIFTHNSEMCLVPDKLAEGQFEALYRLYKRFYVDHDLRITEVIVSSDDE